MSRTKQGAGRAARAMAGVIAFAAVASTAGAQHSTPRHPREPAPAPEPPVSSIPYTPYPGASVSIDPRWEAQQRLLLQQQAAQQGNNRGTVVVIMPTPGAYYPPMLYDAYGRPVQPAYDPSMGAAYPGYGAYPAPVYAAPGVSPSTGLPWPGGTSGAISYSAPAAVPAYTPDLSGSPYVVTTGGDMLVDLPSGERRLVPSCASHAAALDPAGRPRTVFYSGATTGVVLHEGSRGRVQGEPARGVAACYTTDAIGRLTLTY